MWVFKKIVLFWLSGSACGTIDGYFWISFEHPLVISIWHLKFFFLMYNVMWLNFSKWKVIYHALHLYSMLVIYEISHSSSCIWYLNNLCMFNSTLKFSCLGCFTPAYAKCFVERLRRRILRIFITSFFLLDQHLEKYSSLLPSWINT